MFRLKAHGATDLVGYDALKDLGRLESLVDSGTLQNGLLIMLTNEPAYWKEPPSSKLTNAEAFRIHDGANISGGRGWSPNTERGNEARPSAANCTPRKLRHHLAQLRRTTRRQRTLPLVRNRSQSLTG